MKITPKGEKSTKLYFEVTELQRHRLQLGQNYFRKLLVSCY